MKKKVTVDEVMSWKPCGWDGENNGKNYTRERVTKLSVNGIFTPRHIVSLDISAADRAWTLIKMLDENEQHDFARWCARQSLCLRDVPEIVLQFLETRDESLWGAVCDTAWNVAGDPVGTAVKSAAEAAVRGAAWDTAWATAWAITKGTNWNEDESKVWNEAWNTQLEKLLEYATTD